MQYIKWSCREKTLISISLLATLIGCAEPVGKVVTAPCPKLPQPPPSVLAPLPLTPEQLQDRMENWLKSQQTPSLSQKPAGNATTGPTK